MAEVGGETRESESRAMVPHAEKAWAWWRSIGSPRWIVAPMVDQSELPFRLLCRENGAEAAWTPMFHSRLFSEDKNYRQEVWSSCPKDRPVIVQFCANDPNHLCKAAKILEGECDAVDINFGCPQRIAKKGYYGAFLMDNLELVEKLVRGLVEAVQVPVTAKIRIFGPSGDDLAKTIAYARMIEKAGASLITVHGRTREQKDLTATRADWDAIKAVKEALSIPVVANGNIRDRADGVRCLEYTGCQGVMSAESLLVDPALFSPSRSQPGGQYNSARGIGLLRDYLNMVLEYPIPRKMVIGHIHKMIGGWLSEHHDLREKVNNGGLSIQKMLDEIVGELEKRQQESGRIEPVPKVSERVAARLAAEREATVKRAREEQDSEEQALKRLDDREREVNDKCEDCAA